MLVFRLTTCNNFYTRCKMSIFVKKKESQLLGVDWAPITFLLSTPRLPIKTFSLAEGWFSVIFMLVFCLTTCKNFYTRFKMSIFVIKKESLLLGDNVAPITFLMSAPSTRYSNLSLFSIFFKCYLFSFLSYWVFLQYLEPSESWVIWAVSKMPTESVIFNKVKCLQLSNGDDYIAAWLLLKHFSKLVCG